MGEVVLRYQSLYNQGDVVIFNKDELKVGIVEGYYLDDGCFWYNIRTAHDVVYTYTNHGDIGEFDIIAKIDGDLKDECYKAIMMH